MLGRLSDLERRLALPYAILMIGANVIGAVIVFVLVRWVLPLPDVDDPAAVQRTNLVALVAYLAFALPAGTLWVLRLLRPVLAWLRTDRAPSEAEQRQALLAPRARCSSMGRYGRWPASCSPRSTRATAAIWR
ncbi:MAG: adenylate cyclase [Solirubrobacteraceae bacterium]|nr:adenylate cyclase [Solirubrobacteraceae bacterium]